LAKRRRIMQRSMKLGHCVCDPRRPCPCDVFTEQGICPCAGERPDPVPAESVKLTEWVHNAGCASKIAPCDLAQILARLPAVDDPAVVSGIPAGDDAGVYRLTDEATLVQTVDVFTPCVDDPELFGRICAANCLSDIYAMGGVPRTALSIVGFPAETLDGEIMYRMMKGAMDVLAEAGVALIGGHSIKDEEIKLGFAITGTLDAEAVARGSAGVGDVLVLTKPLGVGVLNFAGQIGRPHAAGLAQAAAAMAQLNRPAAEAMVEAGATACTDVTGFGLFGHLIGMARGSGVTAQVFADVLPAFDGALEALADGVIPGAIERNTEYVGDDILVADGTDPARVYLGYDAQTSGGLLIAIPADRHARLLTALADRGVLAVTVGTIVAPSTGRIVVTAAKEPAAAAGEFVEVDDHAPGPGTAGAKAGAPCCCEAPSAAEPCCEAPSPAEPCCEAPAGTEPCCEAPSAAEPCCEAPAGTDPCCCAPAPGEKAAAAECCTPGSAVKSSSPEAMKGFGTLMRASGADGAIDARAKELINFALVLLARCGPCVDVHLAKARKMGITQAELDEAAWCAVAMGGAPVKLFYAEALKRG